MSCLVAGVLLALLLGGCSMGSAVPDPRLAATTSAGPQPRPVRPATELTLGEHSCWDGELLGSDPQLALKLAGTFGVSYFDAALALKDRPAFLGQLACGKDHAIEVYRLVQAADLALVTDYAQVMQPRSLDYLQLSAAVSRACADPASSAAAVRSGVPSASVQPALPSGFRLRWAPATFEQWNRGQHVFACLLVQDDPSTVPYAALRSRDLPTQLRTCIASGPRIYVDCARRHDREVIARIDVTGAVASGTFPGSSALRVAANGQSFLDRDAAFYRPLDRACTAYLRLVSGSSRLTGVAEIDPRAWPDADGTYAISCEAGAAPGRPPTVTRGSVYDRR